MSRHLTLTPEAPIFLALTLLMGSCNGVPPRTAQQDPPAGNDRITESSVPIEGEADFQNIFSRVAKSVIPAVVSVQTERQATGRSPFDFFGFPFGGPGQPPRPQEGLGSGFIIDPRGLIVTNNHVIEGAASVTVRLADEREFPAEVVGADPPTELAVLRIQGEVGDLPVLPFGNSQAVEIGDWVVAVGAPFGLYQSVTTGIISAKGRTGTGITTYGDFLQTDAAINPGNSGGPLVNLRGQAIGINTAIFSQTGGYQGIGFAIPSDLARGVIEDLVEEGKVTRGWLGVSVQPVTPEMAEALDQEVEQGALVNNVFQGGPAARAGIQRGDVIVGIDGEPVREVDQLLKRVAEIRPGTRTQVTVVRNGDRREFAVEVMERTEERLARQPQGQGLPQGANVPSLGLRAAPLSPQLREEFNVPGEVERGVVITGMERGPAAAAGLRPGDVILAVNRRQVQSVERLRQALRQAGERRVLILVNRQGQTFFTVVIPR